jgi:transcriptional regulator with XRE-family HTH domain
MPRKSREELPQSLGSWLRAHREGRAMTLTEMADKLEVSCSYVCDVERGRKGVSLGRAAQWSRRLGTDETVLVRLAMQQLLDDAGLRLRADVQHPGPKVRRKRAA